MVSRRKILSRPHDGLNTDFQGGEDDIWFQKERLFKDHIQEILNKWKQIDDEIWAKIIVMERNRRVAKAYARVPVLTINGSDDGFDGYRIGLCGFENPMRDAKTEEIKKHIGHGIKIKMDDGGNIMAKRVGRSSVYVKEVKSSDSGSLLEFEKSIKIFDINEFAANVNLELKKAYPDRRKLESQCITVISFVKDNSEILDCPCWLMVINIVALDMLRTKLPPVLKSSETEYKENPYSFIESPFVKMETLRDPKPPRLPPRDVPVPMPDYDDWKHERSMYKFLQQSGSKDDPYYCGMKARVPNFGKKTHGQRKVAEVQSSGHTSLHGQNDRKEKAGEDFTPSHNLMFVGEWE